VRQAKVPGHAAALLKATFSKFPQKLVLHAQKVAKKHHFLSKIFHLSADKLLI
jgi:hypothetical protein